MPLKILVVDDTKFMRNMLSDILKQFGYEVAGEAENGRQAVQRFEELRPDVVFLDITMPEMDGLEAMKEIRRIEPNAVVLICSAMSQQDLISDALKAGANGYVMKPFKPNRVNEIIRKYAIPHLPVKSNPPEEAPQKREAPAAGEDEVLRSGVSAGDAGKELIAPEEKELLLSAEPESAAVSAEPGSLPHAAAHVAETEESLEQAKEEEALQPVLAAEDGLDAGAGGSMDLEQLNDLTLAMAGIEPGLRQEAQASPLPNPAAEMAGFAGKSADGRSELLKRAGKPGQSGKIVNLFKRGNDSMKNFVSSYMCNWSEDVNGEACQFLVICNESESKITIEMAGSGNQKQTVSMSLEGFDQLVGWLQDKLGGTSSNVRELSKKAEY
jgi:CheY-like chemotaxis protein